MSKFPESARRSDRRSGIRIGWIVSALLYVALGPVSRASQSKMIITWGGNTPAWNKKLHLNAIRMGCSDAPASCVRAVNQIASEQHVDKVFLAIALNSSSVSYAQQYSAMSVVDPVLYSVGFDDFVRQMGKLQASTGNVASILDQFVSSLKARNSNLRFGVTIYEDNLSSPELTSSALENVRNRTDFVHLFIHYREDGPNFATYVRQAKALFPKAKIIAGSYSTDRVDYLPCSMIERSDCTASQEISLFEKTFDEQLQLLRDGTVTGIEFSPGNFGNLAQASMWRDPRSCRRDRLPECIANSQKMDDYVATQLAQSQIPNTN